jgi:hypothetical protein
LRKGPARLESKEERNRITVLCTRQRRDRTGYTSRVLDLSTLVHRIIRTGKRSLLNTNVANITVDLDGTGYDERSVLKDMISKATDLILKNALKLVELTSLYGKSRPKKNTMKLFVLIVIVEKW